MMQLPGYPSLGHTHQNALYPLQNGTPVISWFKLPSNTFPTDPEVCPSTE